MSGIGIVFLDFDGVMHRVPVGTNIDRYFEHIQLMAAWLRAHPSVQVVVSSSWRHQYTLAELRDLLFHEHEDLQDRIVGATPDMSNLTDDYKRSSECLAWLYDSGHHYCAWAALDDQPELFTPLAREHLVVCDPTVGLTQDSLAEVQRSLRHQQLDEPARRARVERNGSLMLPFDRNRLRPLPDERAAAARHAIQPLTDIEEAYVAATITNSLSEMQHVDRAEAAATAARTRAWRALPKQERFATAFLDLDEVLCVGQPHAAGVLLESMKDGAAPDETLLGSLFTPAAISALSQIHQQLKGRLRYVISSSWREHFSREQLELIFRRTGLEFVASNLHPGEAWRCHQAWFSPDRSADIEEWLKTFHSGEPFAILDDRHSGGNLNFHQHFMDHQFSGRVTLCLPGTGLTVAHVDEIVNVLKRPIWRRT